MDYVNTIATASQPVAYVLGGLGAWLVVRAAGVDLSAVARDADARTGRRGRAVLWLILAGLMAAPFRFVSNDALFWVYSLRVPGTLHQMPALSLLATLGSSAGIVAGYLLAWWFFRRIDWAGVGQTTGWHSTFWQRLFLFLALGLFLTWPIMAPLQVVAMARFGSQLSGASVGQQWVGIAQSLIGYVLGLWAAGSILRRVAGRYDRFFKDANRLITLVLLIALTSMLAQGVVQLFDLLNQVLQPFLSHPQNMLAFPPASPASVRWMLNELPLLAYLMAIPVMRRIDWEGVEARSGWRPSALEEVLIFLTLSAWLAWPFVLLKLIITGALPALLPGFALTFRHVAVAVVALVVLYLAFLYNPGSEKSAVGGS